MRYQILEYIFTVIPLRRAIKTSVLSHNFFQPSSDVSMPLTCHSVKRGRSAEKNVKFGWAQSFEIPDKVCLPVLILICWT